VGAAGWPNQLCFEPRLRSSQSGSPGGEIVFRAFRCGRAKCFIRNSPGLPPRVSGANRTTSTRAAGWPSPKKRSITMWQPTSGWSPPPRTLGSCFKRLARADMRYVRIITGRGRPKPALMLCLNPKLRSPQDPSTAPTAIATLITPTAISACEWGFNRQLALAKNFERLGRPTVEAAAVLRRSIANVRSRLETVRLSGRVPLCYSGESFRTKHL
jgi:hypothetical protein